MATRNLDASVIQRLSEDHQLGVFFSLKAIFDSDTIRLWSGVDNISLPTGSGGANETYLGSGNLVSITKLEESRDLKSDGINVALSYVTPELLSIATTESYQNRKIELRMGFTEGKSNTALTGTFIIFRGRMTNMAINDDPIDPTIEVQCENRLIDLQRPSNFRYTSESQKFLHGSSDTFFRFVKQIQDKEILWGRTSSGGSGGGGGGTGGGGTVRREIQR